MNILSNLPANLFRLPPNPKNGFCLNQIKKGVPKHPLLKSLVTPACSYALSL
jgi:hypothetical protein